MNASPRFRHPQISTDQMHGPSDGDPSRTRYHGDRAPRLADTMVYGPFGLCAMTRDQYVEHEARSAQVSV